MICKGITLICRKDGPEKDQFLFPERADLRRGFYEFHAWGPGWTEIYRVLFLGVAFCNGQNSVEGMLIPVWLMVLCFRCYGRGYQRRRREDHQVCGNGYGKTGKIQGFSADLAGAFCLLLASVSGIPVSTTHTKTSAIMGVGAVKRLSAINFGVVKDMMLTWIFTFPGCGLISFIMAKIFMMLF